MWTIVTDPSVAWFVCQSVCPPDTHKRAVKTAERIDVLFWVETLICIEWGISMAPTARGESWEMLAIVPLHRI